MIMTLAMATFLQGLLIIIAGGSAVTAQNPLIAWFGGARPLGIPAGVALWAIVTAVTLLVLHATPLGARIFAVGATRSRRRSRACRSNARRLLFTPSAA